MRKLILSLIVAGVPFLTCLAQGKTYVFATYTYATNNRLQNLSPLVAILAEQTGLHIEAKSYPTVQALISAIKNDSVDFAMINTSGYLVLKRRHPDMALPLVNLELDSVVNASYSGCLIANKGTGIASTKALKATGKKLSLALVNSSSTSGNLVPRLILNSSGIKDAEASFAVSYSGTHKKVVEDVLSGKADVGGCGCPEVDSARNNLSFASKAVVIDSLNDIPLGPIVFHKKLGEPVVRLVAGKLLSIHQSHPSAFSDFCDGWTEFKQAKRFKVVADKHYDPFRKLFGNNKKLWKLIE